MITRKSRSFIISKWLKRISFLFLAILLILVVIFMVNYWQVKSYLNRPITPNKEIVSSLNDSDMGLIPIDKLEQVVLRPLFMSTRRPVESVDVEDVENNPIEENEPVKAIIEKLSSIIIVDGKKTAFLEGKDSTIRLEEGMSYNGWTVINIESDQVVISDGKSSETLMLRTFAVSSPTEPKKLGK